MELIDFVIDLIVFVKDFFLSVWWGLGAALVLIWRLVVLALKDPTRNDFERIKGYVENETPHQKLYEKLLKYSLGRVDLFYETRRGIDSDYGQGNPGEAVPFAWSARAYDRSLLFAVAYPIGAAFIGWALFGSGGDFAQLLGLHDQIDGWQRGFIVAGEVLLIWLLVVSQRMSHWTFMVLAALISAIVLIAVGDNIGPVFLLFVLPFAAMIRFAILGSGAAVITLFACAAFAIVFAFSFIVVGIFAFVFSVIFCVAIVYAIAKSKQIGFLLILLSILYMVAIFGVGFYAGEWAQSALDFSVLIAVVLLPLINAPFDWLSVGLTRHLLRKNLIEKKIQFRALYSLIDFVGAMILMVLLAVVLVAALDVFNGVAGLGGFSGTVINVKGQLLDIQAEPSAPRHFWLYFALFSTLIPTMAHLIIWLFSINALQLRFFQPWLVEQLNSGVSDGAATKRMVELLITARFILPVLLSFAVAAVIAFLFQNLFGFGTWLLDLLLLVQAFVAAMFV